jgi:hypothetical protein
LFLGKGRFLQGKEQPVLRRSQFDYGANALIKFRDIQI